MFTGLVETLGTVAQVRRGGRAVTLCVKADARDYAVTLGASVSIDGVCLTVENFDKEGAMFFCAVEETLSRTTLRNVTVGRRVNLERAMPANGRLDGHFVLGHVDAVGKIIRDEHVGVSLVRTIELPQDLTPLVAKKGSVAIDGISLTVADVSSSTFSISLIPATLKNTTMSVKKTGDEVNIECDVLARYMHNILTRGEAQDENLLNKMKSLGY